MEPTTAAAKRCSRCQRTKPLSEFYRQRSSRDGHQGYCKRCQSGTPQQRARMQRHRLENPEIHRQRRAEERFAKYGLTAEAFDALLIEQAGRCSGCGEPMMPVCVDHDHATGAVRGLLCRDCNLALGFAGDDPDRLHSLAAYLER